MLDRKSAVIAMFIVSFFTIFLAVKQFLVFRDQIYQEAYNGVYSSNHQ